MITYNEEQMEFLKEHEKQLFTATYQEYYRSTNTKILDKMKEIYDSVAESPYPSNWSCGHCVLDFLRHVGKIYFDTKNSLRLTAQQITDKLNEEIKRDSADKEKHAKQVAAQKASNEKAKAYSTKKSPRKTTKK